MIVSQEVEHEEEEISQFHLRARLPVKGKGKGKERKLALQSNQNQHVEWTQIDRFYRCRGKNNDRKVCSLRTSRSHFFLYTRSSVVKVLTDSFASRNSLGLAIESCNSACNFATSLCVLLEKILMVGSMKSVRVRGGLL